jgi:hypothetical protein
LRGDSRLCDWYRTLEAEYVWVRCHSKSLLEDGSVCGEIKRIINSGNVYLLFSLKLFYNIHGFNDVRETEIHTAEPLVSEPSSSDVLIAIEKLKRYKSPGTDQSPAELIQAGGGGDTLRSESHKLINCIWNKEELPEKWKESIIVPIYKKGDKMDCSNYREISLLSTSYKVLLNILLSRLTPYVDDIIVDFDVIVQLLIIYFAFVRYWRKNGSTMGLYISYL